MPMHPTRTTLPFSSCAFSSFSNAAITSLAPRATPHRDAPTCILMPPGMSSFSPAALSLFNSRADAIFISRLAFQFDDGRFGRLSIQQRSVDFYRRGRRAAPQAGHRFKITGGVGPFLLNRLPELAHHLRTAPYVARGS